MKTYREPVYAALFLSGELNSRLSEIDAQAESMFFQFCSQLVEREGITERLKADCQMEWVERMNNIRKRVTEMVNEALIFV